jgi:hypothetical protein
MPRAQRLSLLVAIASIALAGSVEPAHGAQGSTRIVVPNPDAEKPIAAGTGVLSGQVRDAKSNATVPGATVVLALEGHASARVLTDERGRFSFPNLPRGEFSITATLAGFAPGAYGRVRPAGSPQPLTINEGERLVDLAILVWPLASISGTVVDDLGEPVVGVAVQAYRRSPVAGRLGLVPAASDATDDRGVFRISGLEPGQYIVGVPVTSHTWPTSLENHMLQGGHWPQDLQGSSAGQLEALIGSGMQMGSRAGLVVQMNERAPLADLTADGHLIAYGSQFFPGVAGPSEASVIVLTAGEERSGVSLSLRAERTSNVSGTVSGIAGASDDLVLRLVAVNGGGASPINTGIAVTDFRGRFTFAGVPAGQYVIRALRQPRSEGGPVTQAPLPVEPLVWVDHPITVDAADVTGLTLDLNAGLSVRGRVEFRGTRPQPAAAALEKIRLSLQPADESTAGLVPSGVRGRIERDAQFATIGAPAGRYVVSVTGAPDGWVLESVMHGGRDVSIDALKIDDVAIAGVSVTFTDRPSGLAGVVSSPSGGGDQAAAVIVFPIDPASRADRGIAPRQIRSVRPDRLGSFSLQDLPPGKYFVVAISDVLAGEWQLPEFLESLTSHATRVDLALGETRQLQLQTVRLNVR